MKLLYQDLLKFLNEKPSKEILSERLFQLGHEHEINGEIFDMELTPNRGDCISLKGLARDLNAFFGKDQPFKIYKEDIEPLSLDFKNLSPEICPKISFLQIEIDGNVNKYRSYLEDYFSLLGNNKVNFFTDISNYLSYELGQPTHCFDYDTINGQLVFENRICKESFKTLLGSEINLTGKNSVFSVNNEIISLAGVMGGMSTSCKENTKKVLIECAFFLPEAIIGKSIKYNLISDAAHRFERGVDIGAQEKVLRRFIEIVKDHTSIKKIKIQSFDSNCPKKTSIPIDVKRINKILGINLHEKDYLKHLQDLGFDTETEIIIPSFRHDISSQNDLAEEIARVVGYNNIKSKPFKIDISLDKNLDDNKKIKNFLVQNGFHEIINFPFTSKGDKKSISIDNPLDSNRNYLRTSLKNSLLNNLLYNERRQKDSIKLFEISDIYSKNNQICEEKKLGIIISGRKDHNYLDFSKTLDHGYLNNLLNNSNNSVFKIEEISRSGLKTKRKEKIYFTEILIEDIPKDLLKDSELSMNKINFKKYEPISEFPSSIRDFSFSITDFQSYHEVIDYLSGLSDENLKNAYIFDFYKNTKLKEIKVGIRLVFQSSLDTLSDEEIQKSVNRILMPVVDLKGVSIPGFEHN